MRLPAFLAGRRPAPKEIMIHLPDDLLSPERIAILAGSTGFDSWAALFLANSVARSLPGTAVEMILPAADVDVPSLLDVPPAVTVYGPGRGGRGSSADVLPDARIVMVVSEFPDSAIRPIAKRFRDAIRIYTRPDEDANLVFNLTAMPVPARMYELSKLLGACPDTSWRPSVPRGEMAQAASLLSPVSGSVLPYMATTVRVADILRRRGAELPMRVVPMDSKEGPVAGQPPSVKAAVIAGATVVATDDPVHWAQASAMGVPVIGLDRKSAFPNWGGPPARDAQGLADSWAELLRTGW